MDFLRDAIVGSFQHFKLGSVHCRPGYFLYYSQSTDGAVASQGISMPMESLPELKKGHTRIIVASDTHARHRGMGPFPEGDIFLHTGDILMTSTLRSRSNGIRTLADFNEWLEDIPCENRVVIAGNHDVVIEEMGKESTRALFTNCIYLENDSVTVNDLSIWGSPLSRGRSHNRAFQSQSFADSAHQTLADLAQPVDIVLTHGPCRELYSTIASTGRNRLPSPIHFWGHWHGGHGIHHKEDGSLSVCACIMDGRYDLSNLPIVIDCDIA